MESSSHMHKYYPEITLFRGFAIFGLIFGHCMECVFRSFPRLSPGPEEGLYYKLSAMSCLGVTWYFVFISGFLFYGVFYRPQFSSGRFMAAKLKKVFLPYFIFASAFTLLNAAASHAAGGAFGPMALYISYFYGSFWYIPFIMCLFALSPLFVRLIEVSFGPRWALLALSLLLAVATPRNPLNPVLSCLHFFCAYLWGIMICMGYERVCHASTKSRIMLALGLLGWMLCLASGPGWREEAVLGCWLIAPFAQPSPVVPVKLGMCVIFIWIFLWLQRHGPLWLTRALQTLATYSFTLFFFHNFLVLWYFSQPTSDWLESLGLPWLMVAALGASVLICAGSITLFALPRRLLGRYSRMILGC